MKRLAILASGSGTNAEAIMNFFEQNPNKGKVVGVISNNKNAYVLQRAKSHNVDQFLFEKATFYNEPQTIINILEQIQADWIILAGFMLLLHNEIVEKFKNKIINIHPALLPKYGGKGMYGHFVHEAVVAAKESHTGITIHYVNGKYDEGAVIFQATTQIDPNDTAEDVATRVQLLEQEHFPRVISETINKN